MAEKDFTRAGTIELDTGDTYSVPLYIQQIEVFGGVDGVAAIALGDTFLLQTQNTTPVTIYAGVASEGSWADVRYRNRWYNGLTATISGGGRIVIYGRQAMTRQNVDEA